ncbi:MAG: hypothetical protein ACREBH_03970 [Candidatus Micrarchaeaceae archaeon]
MDDNGRQVDYVEEAVKISTVKGRARKARGGPLDMYEPQIGLVDFVAVSFVAFIIDICLVYGAAVYMQLIFLFIGWSAIAVIGGTVTYIRIIRGRTSHASAYAFLVFYLTALPLFTSLFLPIYVPVAIFFVAMAIAYLFFHGKGLV